MSMCKVCGKEIDYSVRHGEYPTDRVKAIMVVDIITDEKIHYHVECYEGIKK